MEIEYGKPYKYKEMLSLMEDIDSADLSNGSGQQRKLQLKRWQQYYDIEKVGYKFIIHQKYNGDIMAYNIKKTQRRFLYSLQFLVSKENEKLGGIYIIKQDNNVYIGQTYCFIKRFCQHTSKYASKYASNTKSQISQLLKNGGVFYVLEIENDRDKRLELEKQYITKYKNDGYNMINSDLMKDEPRKEYSEITINIDDIETVEKLLRENNIEYRVR